MASQLVPPAMKYLQTRHHQIQQDGAEAAMYQAYNDTAFATWEAEVTVGEAWGAIEELETDLFAEEYGLPEHAMADCDGDMGIR